MVEKNAKYVQKEIVDLTPMPTNNILACWVYKIGGGNPYDYKESPIGERESNYCRG